MANRDFVSKWLERPLPSEAIAVQRTAHAQKSSWQKRNWRKLVSPADDEAIKKQKTDLEQLEKEMPAWETVMAVEEGDAADLPIHLRGNHLKPGPEKISRGMPVILTQVVRPAEIAESRSGRLELAQWLVSPQNPLTAG